VQGPQSVRYKTRFVNTTVSQIKLSVPLLRKWNAVDKNV